VVAVLAAAHSALSGNAFHLYGSFLLMARRIIRAPNLTRRPEPLHRLCVPNRRPVLPMFLPVPLQPRHRPNGHRHRRASQMAATASTIPASTSGLTAAVLPE